MVASADTFVGRHDELEALRMALAAGARLITLVGPPGIGKSRLAFELVQRLPRSASATEPCVVDLALAGDAPAALGAIGRALGLGAARGKKAPDPWLAVGRCLAARGQSVLVLDNAEHLVGPISHAVARWMMCAPEARFIVTSRERLSSRGEWCFAVEPLGVAAGEGSPRSDAAALFVDRMRGHAGTFVGAEGQEEEMTELLRRLDGVPLAIELAAARAAVVGIRALGARLSQGLDALGHGPRDGTRRDRTLRGAIEWSFLSLSDEEQRVLARCSVFRGGFGLRLAEHVLSDLGPATRTVELLHSLRDKSMVRVLERGGTVRFDLYFGVRERAREHLALDEDEDEGKAVARHADAVLALASELRAGAEQTFSSEILSALELERSNLVLAHAVRRAPGSVHGARGEVEAVLALEPILLSHGPAPLLEEIASHVLLRPDAASLPAVARARILRARGKAHQLAGSLDQASRDLAEALELAGPSGEASLVASLHVDRGILHQQRRQLTAAATDYELALALFEQEGSTVQRARVQANLASVHHDARRLVLAERAYRKALRLLRRMPEPRLSGTLLSNLGALLSEQEQWDEADDHLARAEADLGAANDLRLLGIAQGNRGAAALARGDARKAEEHLESSVRHLTAVGDLTSLALSLARLAAARAGCSEPAGWRASAAEATRLLDPEEDPLTACAVRLYAALAELRAADSITSLELARARARIAEASLPLPHGEGAACDVSDEVRAALRLLEQALSDAEPLGALLALAPDDALVVGPGAAWFRAPGSVSQSLHAHGPVRRVLSALTRERLAGSGRALDVDTLREAGWPGEKMNADAAANRVHVALAELRRRGLRAFIRRMPEGYVLSRDLPVHEIDR